MNLRDLRKEIDRLDEKLLKILAKRKQVVNNIFKHKIKLNLPLVDLKRERELLKSRRKPAQKLNLSPKFVRKLFRLIINSTKEEKNG